MANFYALSPSTGGSGGSVSSVDVSGGSTGLTTSGGPITTAGIITLAGTLNATHGGTGFASYTTGDLLYASSSTALSKLAIGTAGQVLKVSGGLPSWGTDLNAVTSVSNSDGTLTISPTTGAVVASLNLAHANIWTAMQTVNFNAVAPPTPATGAGLVVVAADAAIGRMEIDTFGQIGAFTVRRANGTGAAPTALLSGDQIGSFNWHGYYVTGGPAYSGVQSNITSYVTQNWTSTALGTKVVIRVTPNNSTTLTDALTINQDGSVTAAGAITGSNFTGFANPSASLGLSAVNGSATTAMRSDAAPALSQAIVPTWTGIHTFLQAGIGAVSTDGIVLSNTTAAAAGAQQWSPRVHWIGQGWKTTATAASQTADWIAELIPVQGSTNPTSLLQFSAQINGGGYTPAIALGSSGSNLSGVIKLYIGNPTVNTGFGSNDATVMSMFCQGTVAAALGATTFALSSATIIGFSSGGAANTSADTILLRRSAANLQHGGVDAAAPVAQTISFQSVIAGTSNVAGANATWDASIGTGTGASGSFIWRGHAAGGSGTSQNTLVQTMSLTGAGTLTPTGDIKIGTVGKGLYVKEGANATMGTGTLSGGTATISTTKVTASSRIFVSDQGGGVLANIGALYISAVSAGTSFTVSSSNVIDSSNFAWIIFEPA